jgi:hypothetical protein
MKMKLTKNVNTKVSSIKKTQELPSSEDSEEKIRKKNLIIKQTVIVTHSRPMSALFKEAVKVTKQCCCALHGLHMQDRYVADETMTRLNITTALHRTV